jgi:predicted nucleic acid-binding protein
MSGLSEGPALADTSAWERAGDARVRTAWTEAMLAGRIVTSLPVRYELLFSARDPRSFRALEERLAVLRDLAVTASVQRAAMTAMRELADLGHHRIPLPDLLIAAVAQEHSAVVVHEDRHFEQLQRVLSFKAERLLPTG